MGGGGGVGWGCMQGGRIYGVILIPISLMAKSNFCASCICSLPLLLVLWVGVGGRLVGEGYRMSV